MLRKFLLSFLSFVILLTSSLTYFSVPRVYAQADTQPWYFQSFPQWYTKVYDTQTSPPQEIFGERYTAAQVQWVMYSLIALFPNFASTAITCMFKGGGVSSCSASNPLVSNDVYRSPFIYKGVFASIFDPNRAISGINYTRSKLASIHVIPQAEAQTGFGFGALNPVQNLWRVFRDIMYGFFVIIIIVFAFMIMFRVKLNPQTVVTVQSAIPKIIITLILVTFSYAIAGLMIDLTYVAIGIIALIFTQSGFIQGLSSSQAWSLLFGLITNGPDVIGLGGLLGWFVGYLYVFALAFFKGIFSLWSLGGAGGYILTIVLTIVGVFLIIGVFLWLIVTLAKVFIALIKAYLSVLISVIFSPFLIGFGAILPTGGFSSWLKGLLSNLLIYPLTGALILISILFLTANGPFARDNIGTILNLPAGASITDIFSVNTSQYWYPPLTLGTQTGGWDPLPFLWCFASLAVFAMIPKAADIIKGLMSGKGVEGLGGGLTAGVAALGGYALGTAKRAGGAYFEGIDRSRSEDIARMERLAKRPDTSKSSYDRAMRIIQEKEESQYGARRWRRRLGL